jgi:hypothetical protein
MSCSQKIAAEKLLVMHLRNLTVEELRIVEELP